MEKPVNSVIKANLCFPCHRVAVLSGTAALLAFVKEKLLYLITPRSVFNYCSYTNNFYPFNKQSTKRSEV